MKKLKYIAASALLLAAVVVSGTACGARELPSPVGFAVDDSFSLSWSRVDDAKSYLVSVKNVLSGETEEKTTRKTSYSLSKLDEGDYEIRIRAMGDGNSFEDSAWSEVYPFHKDYESGCLFELINNGTEYRLRSAGSSKENVVVEEVYRGKRVTEVGDRAFTGSKVESVELGKYVKSIGVGAFMSCSRLTSIDFPDGVTQIGDSAFISCYSLTSVQFPESLKTIGNSAFAYCQKLSKLEFPDSLVSIGAQAFIGLGGVSEIVIPDSVVTIGESAFGKSGANKVTIGKSLQTIAPSAFYQSPNLTEIVFPENGALTRIGNSAFGKCTSLQSVTVPEGVVSIDGYAFTDDTALESVDLPDSLRELGIYAFGHRNQGITKIVADQFNRGEDFAYVDGWLACVSSSYFPKAEEGETIPAVAVKANQFRSDAIGIADSAFRGSTNLAAVELPANIKYIGDAAFYSCPQLWKFIAPAGGVEILGDYAFCYSAALSTVQFGTGLTEIGNYAFGKCTVLQENEFNPQWLIPSTVTRVGQNAFVDTAIYAEADKGDGVVYVNDWIVDYTYPHWQELKVTVNGTEKTILERKDGPSSVVIKDKIRGIADYAFYDAQTLQSITGVQTATYIGQGAFRDCVKLASVSLREGIAKIEPETFYQCSELFRIGLPATVKEIGDYAFAYCTTLSELNFSGTRLETIGDFAFYGDTNVKTLQFGESSRVKSIGNYAFYNNSALAEIVIPDTVTYLGAHAFSKCASLSSVTIGSGITAIPDFAFYGVGVGSVEIPDTVQSIGDYAFYGSKLQSVDLGSVKEIGDYAFARTLLEAVAIPDSTETIGAYAFKSCPLLQSVILSKNVKEIGKNAFYGCFGTVYTTAEGNEWGEKWNSSFRPLIGGCTLSEDGTYVESVTLGANGVLNPNAWLGLSDPVREGYDFVGWATQSGASSGDYQTAEIVALPAGTVLYAVYRIKSE